MTEKFWGWQPSETKRLTWGEVLNYLQHAKLIKGTKNG